MIATLKKLHNYWSEKKRRRPFPARDDLDPIDFHYALGDVSLIDVDQPESCQSPVYKIRLLGSNIQERIGGSYTNRNLEEFPEAGSLRKMRIAYQEVLKTKEPLAYTSCFKTGEKKQPFICCVWPLSSDGEKINMLLCCREHIIDRSLLTDQTSQFSASKTWPYREWSTSPLFSSLTQ
ncbi:PAS domain-containing protein [Kiloniella sp.]|uniref:PAS domain-containing protein n=1 Tax=Kiloniella sp. TaxID=1938587 RepID=UPI003A9359FF